MIRHYYVMQNRRVYNPIIGEESDFQYVHSWQECCGLCTGVLYKKGPLNPPPPVTSPLHTLPSAKICGPRPAGCATVRSGVHSAPGSRGNLQCLAAAGLQQGGKPVESFPPRCKETRTLLVNDVTANNTKISGDGYFPFILLYMFDSALSWYLPGTKPNRSQEEAVNSTY
jgi:hypothetical protein